MINVIDWFPCLSYITEEFFNVILTEEFPCYKAIHTGKSEHFPEKNRESQVSPHIYIGYMIQRENIQFSPRHAFYSILQPSVHIAILIFLILSAEYKRAVFSIDSNDHWRSGNTPQVTTSSLIKIDQFLRTLSVSLQMVFTASWRWHLWYG